MGRRAASILICTHRAAFGQFLKRFLEGLADAGPVRVVSSPEEAARALGPARPVVFLDAGQPGGDVFQWAKRVRGRAGVIFVADGAPLGWVSRAVEAGAAGYLGPCADVQDYERAYRAVRSGARYFTPCAASVIGELAARGREIPVPGPRELEVLRRMSEGRTSKEISRALGLKPKAVDAIRSRLLRKTGTQTAAALVRYACDERFIDPRPWWNPGGRAARRGAV